MNADEKSADQKSAARDQVGHNGELKNTTYELFIAALSILSILNLFISIFGVDADVVMVTYIMDTMLSIIFFGDFLYRLFTAHSKSIYVFRQYGWADLLASLPFPHAKILRLFRIFRAGRLIHRYGAQKMVHEFVSNRGGSALLTLLFLMILVLEYGAIVMLQVERGAPDANIKGASDALWYVYVTITTVGYGDRYPVTTNGRIVGIVVMTMGVGLFGTLTGFLANAFLAPKKEEQGAQVQSLPQYTAEIDRLSEQLKEQELMLSAMRQMLIDQQALRDKKAE